MLLQKNIECGAVFCVCDFRVACFYVCAAFGFASVPYAPMPVLCPNTPKERILLQVSVYQQNKHVSNSLCKLLSIRCLTCSKIQAIYFKIQGTYFKICALCFLRDALCFFTVWGKVRKKSRISVGKRGSAEGKCDCLYRCSASFSGNRQADFTFRLRFLP